MLPSGFAAVATSGEPRVGKMPERRVGDGRPERTGRMTGGGGTETAREEGASGSMSKKWDR